MSAAVALDSTTAAASAPAFESRFFTSSDGLRLHMRDYGPRYSTATPVVCLPGLARTAGDFDRLARHLAAGADGLLPRRVVALDYRGRGLSDWDKNWKNYDIFVESADIQNVLTAAGIDAAIFIGTSRGGLHIMALAALRPGLLRAAVMNDIGPILEAKGLARIRAYVGRLPQPSSWADAVDLFKKMSSTQFTKVEPEDWETYARLTFEEKKGRLVPQYDPALMKTLEALDLESPLPVLWPQFDALAALPLLVIRGENSDLLAQTTFEEMGRCHKGCETLLVPGQGHAPMLLDALSIGRITDFVGRADAKKQ